MIDLAMFALGVGSLCVAVLIFVVGAKLNQKDRECEF